MVAKTSLDLVKQCRTVDAFVGSDAKGNPAGVLVLERPLTDDVMLSIAKEMGHAETAFLVPRRTGEFDLRWFTPAAEVPLCGHATLASAWILWNEFGEKSAELGFYTLSGRLSARRKGSLVELDFPADTAQRWTPAPELLRALGVTQFVVATRSSTTHKMLIQLRDAASVRGLKPDFAALKKAVPGSKGGVIVTASGANGYDFVSRYFHPWVGVDEDPVTGSAHCLLATHWAVILGKNKLRAFQDSERGGVLEVALAGTGRVFLRGNARGR